MNCSLLYIGKISVFHGAVTSSNILVRSVNFSPEGAAERLLQLEAAS